MQPGDQVSGDPVRWRPGVPAGQEPPSYEVLAALVVSLRGARARERIAELEDRLRKTSRNSSMPPSGEGLAKPPPGVTVAAEEDRAQAGRAGRTPGHDPGAGGEAGPGVQRGRPVTSREPVDPVPRSQAASWM